MNTNNIQAVVDNALCTACGSCAGICPKHAIKMDENPAGYLYAQIDNSACDNCGLCAHVCPSHHKNTLAMPDNLLRGNCLEGYIGHATCPKVRLQSQSGGIVSALLLFLLETGKIDGAVINQFDSATHRPKAILATSREDILKGCGSYYTQSPVIETLLEHRDKKTAVVVLGCQAESLELISTKMKRIALPEYRIGLICAGTNSGRMIDDLLHKTAYSRTTEQVMRFRFRAKDVGGWPGDVLLETEKHRYVLKKRKRLQLKQFYEAHRCLSCYDQMNVLSDVVCGDPWGIGPQDEHLGYTVVVARTAKGRQLLEEAKEAGYISITALPVDDIMEGQTVDIRHQQKVSVAAQVFTEKGWLYPYPIQIQAALKASLKIDKSIRSGYRKRLIKSRKHYLAKNCFVAKCLVLYEKTLRILRQLSLLPRESLRKWCVKRS